MPTLLEQLDLEWHHHIGHNARAARQLPEIGELTNTATLDAAKRWTHNASAADADQVLLALVRRSTTGDQIAARVLMQFLMPGIARIVRRWADGIGRADTEAAVVAAVYDRIRNYPLERRPGKVAANILLDATRPIRRLVCDPHNTHTNELRPDPADTPTTTSGEELLGLIADAVHAGHLEADDASLIATTRIGGINLATLANATDRHPRTLQRHRKRAEAVLAAAARTELTAA